MFSLLYQISRRNRTNWSKISQNSAIYRNLRFYFTTFNEQYERIRIVADGLDEKSIILARSIKISDACTKVK